MTPTIRTALALGLLAATGCSAGDATGDDVVARPTVVVTYSVLGSVVADLVGEAADVTVLMPDGVDPHEWEPSPRDIEAVANATVVVSNGFGLEESLVDIIEAEAARHVEAAQFVTPRLLGDDDSGDDHADESGDEHSADDGHDHAEDPHLWMDPLAMRDVVIGIAPLLADAGIDVSARVDDVAGDLERLAAEVDDVVAVLAADQRRLVTGHESLGWFADRFGFDLVGAVVPSLTSQAEASAGDLAALDQVIEETGVPTIFTELGTPPEVVEAIADATGVDVVEIATHDMPDDGQYATFVLDIAERIVTGLSAGGGA